MFKFKPPNYPLLADEKLIVAITNGDSSAFNELYKRYNERMLYYFYRMLWNDKEMAQDFLQDLFIKIIDKPHLFDVERKFSTWIFSIAHNMCKNEYRNRVVRDIVEKGTDTDYIPDDEETTNYSSFQIEDVFSCLNEFDEMHRTAFLLKYREGLSIDEISSILELPVGTVKSRLFYTRKKIQKKLQHKIHGNNEY
ncbi:MAG: RNA polymerase sigma factor [Bacteroidales bacterium]|nr:RNA polymerase sigma factor [Bacteroidales bacterium]